MTEVIVVGAGHNGLICAAYLARAGLDTLLLEARPDVGGCASTVSDLDARFNICNCDHTMVRAMPAIEELELESHGLRYLEPESGFVNFFYDGSDPWVHFHDQEQTIDGLAQLYPHQVAGYRRYLDDALPVAALALSMAQSYAEGPALLRQAAKSKGRGAARLLQWSRQSVSAVLGQYFDDWRLIMPAVSTGPTVWGVSPDMPGTGLAAALYATRHLVKTGRPEGGSGALTDATRRSFEAAGGRVRCRCIVSRLLVQDEAIIGVELSDGEVVEAPAIVAACDPQRVFVDWLDEVPSGARKLVDGYRSRPVLDGYESKVDAVIDGLPRYRGSDRLAEVYGDLNPLSATSSVSPSPDDLAEAHRLRALGTVADNPTLMVGLPSVLDESMRAQDGKHILSLEALFTPYDLPGGWPGSGEPQRWIDVWLDLVEPGTVSIDRWRAMTPDIYERDFSMHRGHTPSYAGSPLAALLGRETELSRYRTPIDGLYLSGAATFPGAGIFGASGRNAAGAVTRDLRGPSVRNFRGPSVRNLKGLVGRK